MAVFERTKDLAFLRAAIGTEKLPVHVESYLMGQALVMQAGSQEMDRLRQLELQAHVSVVREALASGKFIDGSPWPVYAMEVRAHGAGSTGDAGAIERYVSLARAIGGESRYWLGFGLGCLALLAGTLTVHVSRRADANALEDAADPLAPQRAAEKMRQDTVGNPSRVPYVRTSDSSDIERLIESIETSGVLAARRVSS